MKHLLLIGMLMMVPASWKTMAWGFFAHKKINYLAVFTLPPEMFGFYKQHIEFISEHAVDADKRRYVSESEAPRHYIDLDHYGDNPFDIFPLTWLQAVKRFTEDTLMAYGILPWWVMNVYEQLIAAFRARNANAILRLSTDLGHYLADAHVPLHCIKNYNGQLTNQHGIHAFWETRLPELFHTDYDLFTGKAEFISDPHRKIWDIVKESFLASDSVLRLEVQLNRQFPADKKYVYEQRGNTTWYTYSREYAQAYHRLLADQVERRMRQSILAAGSFWFTAWHQAGRPDLNNLHLQLSEQEKQQMEAEDRMWRTGKVINEKGHTDH